ncbi:N-methyl-L-tryptophan oxidase [Ahniella affigens]|uniref:N-methyl-L-tryptophan oxidase n=1 Tax=Ahniella affigens TaxID=2021234 RepID=A0A2P1PSQ5_9GAMM|nr:N-methyl-L-tryptophan oxidase [Ahniella affigens]AVP97879.1 N-methyl-L-tryptophan oxidase [Ahniella affigens]
MTATPDILVLGLGAMGAATLMHASGRGATVVGIDRFAPPHTHGSTHGESRITRLAIGEGPEYVPLVQRSHQLWRDLEQRREVSLYEACGGLILGCGEATPMHGQAHFFESTVNVAAAHGITHELLDATQIATRWPQFQLTGAEQGYFEPEAGYVRPEACIAAQLAEAKARGAMIHTGERLLSWSEDSRGLLIQTDRGSYRPGQVIVCLGAWLPKFVPPGFVPPGLVSAPALRVTRQVLYWFAADKPESYQANRFPIFIWNWGPKAGQGFYGFPDLGGGVKVATDGHQPCDPDAVPRVVSEAEVTHLYDTHVRSRLRGLGPACVRTATCLYTEAPDARFWIDRVGHNGPIIVSACSGHGFKHSAAIGESVARWALRGELPAVLQPFAYVPER